VRGIEAVRRWQVAHPRRVDALLAVVVFAGVVWGPLSDGDHDHGHHPGAGAVLDAVTIAVLAGACAALTLRRTHPLPVWGVSLLAGVAIVLHGAQPPVAVVLSLLTLYTIGTREPPGTTVLTTAVSAVVYGVAVTVVDGVFGDRTVTLLAFLCAAAAVGLAVRSQRAAVSAAEARARQAEATREEEAVRRVTDERLRIARELHDVVAHHISVINVQAGVARHLMDSRPEQAREAMGLVRESSRTVLTEMSTVLGLLRTGEDEHPTAPAPGLAQVGGLVESMRRSGLDVEVRTVGKPSALSQIADLTAYRVVQESLTNALKHGTGTAELEIDWQPHGVLVEVRNPPRTDGSAAPGGGHGLVGMRERVAAVGGRMTAGPAPDGTFTVCAEIPQEGS
jgi:signal transduction histidine kinase